MALHRRRESNGFSVTDVGHDLLRMGGGYSPVGASFYMARILLSGTISSACMGLVGAGISSYFFGTAALPFLICSCAGFMFGAVGFYRSSLVQSLAMLDRHPRLLQLHLDANFPARGFMTWRREQLRAKTFRASWELQSLLMQAWLTAQPAIDRIYEDRETTLVEEARAELQALSADRQLIGEE
ncbi:hypothetical protein LTR56_023109 [Elasticomyces elasticus]|nr:hypothetical protein LTR56_023109 [Elasticomyces elasticus]KAK3668975.1 hypothetical protein LTR22_000053 [Elasticomyces elasticus]KAK4907224.1 hypothetical protein LTR49_023735 [Elasticomyces elasticus]KAK5759184.1 hypothetical protein LTS12_010653 [Elasticomyces elasticus]